MHGRFADYNHTHTLLDVADSTQQIYLGMPSFHEVRRKYWEKRMARRKAAEQETKAPRHRQKHHRKQSFSGRNFVADMVKKG